MKINKNILTLLIFALFLSCVETEKQNEKELSLKTDSIQVSAKQNTSEDTQITETGIKLTKEESRKQIKERNRIDSIRFDKAIRDAFRIAKMKFDKDSFTKKYEFYPDDSSYVIHIEILLGEIFNSKQKYFLLRRHGPWVTYLDLYKIKDGESKKMIEREQEDMTYIRDTIFDVNGDGNDDFIVHWYPSSGCCRRNVYNVYLNQPIKDCFSNDYEFINPTFSSSEKIIRGVGYGYPGEVELYKYKWNVLKVDTIEFIYPDAKTKGQFIKTKYKKYYPTEKDGIVLKTVPKEYLKIESYEWFSDY